MQVFADVDFDQRNQLPHIPRLDLIGDEAGDAALLVGDQAAQHDNKAIVDFGAHLGIGCELIARLNKQAGEMMLKHLALACGVAFNEVLHV